MRLALSIAVILLATLLPSPAAPTSTTSIVIAEILSDPDTTAGQREFVELWNRGNQSIDLAGWKVRDAPTASGATNSFTFPAWSLPASGRIVIWGGGSADTHGPAWSNAAVWNNAGDGVNVIDAAGNLVDWLGYGTTTAPVGQEEKLVQPKPDKGLALALGQSTWSPESPSPGSASGAVGLELSFTVANLPPTAAFGQLPRGIRPGAPLSIPIVLADENGAGDIATWSIASGTTIVAQGVGIPNPPPSGTAPASGSSWPLQLTVTDQAGATGHANMTLALQWSDLRVQVHGSNAVTMPAAPGAGQVPLAEALIANDGDQAITPLIDLSPFVGPGTFDPQGHVSIGVMTANATVWVQYAGPLTRLPEMPAMSSSVLVFRLDKVPAVAAGSYGTSFTVVPA